MRTNRIRIMALAVASMAGLASAQQLTDAALFSNKNWGSGSNAGFVFTFENSSGTPRFKVNARENTVTAGTRRDTAWINHTRDTWQHVAFTLDQTNGRIDQYLNGVNVATIDLPSGNYDTFQLGLDLNLGQDGTGAYAPNSPFITGRGFFGLVDDVAIWRRPVGATEIADIFNAGVSLGSFVGTTPTIGTDLVGYYGLDGDANDTAGNAEVSNGVWKGTGAKYDTGRFGQAADLEVTNFITLGSAAAFPEEFKFGSGSMTFAAWINEPTADAPPPPPPPAANAWTGLASNNNASSNGNWTVGPAFWNADSIVEVVSGTTAGRPAIFNTSLGTKQVSRFTLGGDGVSTYINFQDGAKLIGVGTLGSTIAPANSNVTINMAGGEINHWGAGEEQSRLAIGLDNSVLNLTMSGTSELAVGTRIADATNAIGFRRPVASDGIPRVGDDILLMDGANAQATITMNGNSVIYTADVFYPGDHPESQLTVVQNDNSKVLVGWDTRWGDDGHTASLAIDWTMNGSSQFGVARDHALGEGGTTEFGQGGTINLTVNDSALFFAGGRVFIGAGAVGAEVNVDINGGEVRAGTLDGSLVVADDTGDAGVTDPVSQDAFITIGHGAKATVNVDGGVLRAGRNIYAGQGGGIGTINLTAGSVITLGNAPVGDRAGNTPDNSTWGVPSADFAGGTTWIDGGGDLFIATADVPADAGRVRNQGFVNVAGGSLNIARDVWVGGFGERGELNIQSGSVSIGRNLAFGGTPLFGGIEGENTVAVLGAKIASASHPTISVGGDVTIFNSDEFSVSSIVSAEIVAPYADYRPATGAEIVLVDYAGSRTGEFASVTDATLDGIVWTLSYDDAGTSIKLVASNVFANGDTDGSGGVGFNDLLTLAQNYGDAQAITWAQGDLDNVGGVDFPDLLILAQNYTGATLHGSPDYGAGTGDFLTDWNYARTLSVVPEPATLGLIAGAALLATRRRR
jgi:hypothetical protein